MMLLIAGKETGGQGNDGDEGIHLIILSGLIIDYKFFAKLK